MRQLNFWVILRHTKEEEDCYAPIHPIHPGLSKKLQNHEHAIVLQYTHYNFARVHQTLRVTPAMEAGVADYVWSNDEIIALLGDNEPVGVGSQRWLAFHQRLNDVTSARPRRPNILRFHPHSAHLI